MAEPLRKRWLDDATLDALYDAAVSADLVDRSTRAVLLQGLPDPVRLALPDLERPDLQFRSDLRQLAIPGPDGRAPLRAWLAEARALAAGRPEEAVFAAALARPDGAGEGVKSPVNGDGTVGGGEPGEGGDGGEGPGDGERGGDATGRGGRDGGGSGGSGDGGRDDRGDGGSGDGGSGGDGGRDGSGDGGRGDGGRDGSGDGGRDGSGGDGGRDGSGDGGRGDGGRDGSGDGGRDGSGDGGRDGGGAAGLRRWWPGIAAGAAGVAVVAAIALGGGDPPDRPDAAPPDAAPVDSTPADAAPPDAAPADAAPPDAAPPDAAPPPPVEFPAGPPLAAATAARPALRVVPAGALRFDDGYGAPRTLTVERAVAMSERPVTRAQYQAVMGVAPPTPTPDPLDPRPHPVKPADPATQLTVSQARAYCDALSRAEGRAPHYASGGDGYRLPSEAEWVMACAAGRPPAEAPAVHPWGAVPGEALWEWVDDRFSRPGPDGRPVVAPGAGQVMRGAGRRLPPADRCRERGELAPGSRGSATGFRVVRPLASTERR